MLAPEFFTLGAARAAHTCAAARSACAFSATPSLLFFASHIATTFDDIFHAMPMPLLRARCYDRYFR